jgi:adenylylsulfate kinase-like enzyme
MTKGLIILGKQGSGKSVLAIKLASEFDFNSVSVLDGKQLTEKNYSRNYLGAKLNRETKVLIIDDLPSSTNWNNLFPLFDKISIRNTCKDAFKVSITKLIVVCCESISLQSLPIGASFHRRFEIQQL